MKVQVLLLAAVLEVLKVQKEERKTENTLQEMVMQPCLLQLCVLLAFCCTATTSSPWSVTVKLKLN